MTPQRWIALGASSMALAVVLGAFGAHALKERLAAAGQLENWRTAVLYQALHALGLIALGLAPARLAPAAVGWLFLFGTVCFSGSIYGLALEGPKAVLGPMTPLGGLLLIAGWCLLAWSAWRRSPVR
jgi:uncharacterized membrane protein YgdD (TMEM256/DUF423 family)